MASAASVVLDAVAALAPPALPSSSVAATGMTPTAPAAPTRPVQQPFAMYRRALSHLRQRLIQPESRLAPETPDGMRKRPRGALSTGLPASATATCRGAPNAAAVEDAARAAVIVIDDETDDENTDPERLATLTRDMTPAQHARERRLRERRLLEKRETAQRAAAAAAMPVAPSRVGRARHQTPRPVVAPPAAPARRLPRAPVTRSPADRGYAAARHFAACAAKAPLPPHAPAMEAVMVPLCRRAQRDAARLAEQQRRAEQQALALQRRMAADTQRAAKRRRLQAAMEMDSWTGCPEMAALRAKKPYYDAGLFCGTSRCELGDAAAAGAVSPPFEFRLPLFTGLELMEQERDFVLPADYVLFMEAKRGGRWTEALCGLTSVAAMPPPPPFQRLLRNVFLERRPRRDETHRCHCAVPPAGQMGCNDESCLNYCTAVECDPTCPLGRQCGNQRFRRRADLSQHLQPFPTLRRGYGLRTLAPIKAGQFIMEYRGEVISLATSMERMRTEYANMTSYYFLDYDDGETIDGTRKGTVVRFANHSCSPNCHVEKWQVGGEFAIGLFANRDIPVNSELTYDYNFQAVGTMTPCHCEARDCRGYIGMNKRSFDRRRADGPHSDDDDRGGRRDDRHHASDGGAGHGRRRTTSSSGKSQPRHRAQAHGGGGGDDGGGEHDPATPSTMGAWLQRLERCAFYARQLDLAGLQLLDDLRRWRDDYRFVGVMLPRTMISGVCARMRHRLARLQHVERQRAPQHLPLPPGMPPPPQHKLPPWQRYRDYEMDAKLVDLFHAALAREAAASAPASTHASAAVVDLEHGIPSPDTITAPAADGGRARLASRLAARRRGARPASGPPAAAAASLSPPASPASAPALSLPPSPSSATAAPARRRATMMSLSRVPAPKPAPKPRMTQRSQRAARQAPPSTVPRPVTRYTGMLERLAVAHFEATPPGDDAESLSAPDWW